MRLPEVHSQEQPDNGHAPSPKTIHDYHPGEGHSQGLGLPPYFNAGLCSLDLLFILCYHVDNNILNDLHYAVCVV